VILLQECLFKIIIKIQDGVNEESRSDTRSHGYSYGHSNQYSNTTQDSLEETINISAQNNYQFSHSISQGKTKTASLQVTLSEDGPQHIVAIPIFISEVTIWATGYIDEEGELKIRYSKSLVPVEFKEFNYPTKFYGDNTKIYNDGLVNPDINRYVFYRQDGRSPNTLSSGKNKGNYLFPGKFIMTQEGTYSFWLLPTKCELILCRGPDISGCNEKDILIFNYHYYYS